MKSPPCISAHVTEQFQVASGFYGMELLQFENNICIIFEFSSGIQGWKGELRLMGTHTGYFV